MWIPGGTVLTVSSRALLSACEKLGVDTHVMLEDAGLTRTVLQDPDARIPTVSAGRLWAKAYELTRDPNLALHVAEALPFGAYRVIDFLAANAPTAGAAVSRVSDYFPIINTTVTLPIQLNAREVTFDLEAKDGTAPVSRPYAEYTFAAVVLRVRTATGCALPLIAAEFAGPSPIRIDEHERIFGCPVRFGRPRHRLRIARSAWDEPVQRADSNLYAVLEHHARTVLERLPANSPILLATREAFERGPDDQPPSLDLVARNLGMSPRTLQRRLRDAGVAFGDLLDEHRRTRAEAYLRRTDIAIAEIAYLLGFSEQSAFTRAFKRWTGRSPATYRRRTQRSNLQAS